MNDDNVSSNSFFGIKVSKPNINVNQASDNELILKDTYSTRTYYDQNGIARILIGLLPDGTFGIVVSQPNIDVRNIFS
jgi:hypothetical protein